MAINEMSDIDKAQDLAMQAHVGQKRKVSKQPYYIHPYRVYQAAISNRLSKTHKILALLHDTYEDSKNKKYVQDKIKSLFGEKMLKLVYALSHDKNIEYNTYLLKLMKGNKVAGEVKMLDMLENLKDNPNEKQKKKYKSAIQYLLDNKVKIDNKILSKLKKVLF